MPNSRLIYQQCTGALLIDGVLAERGYAGHGWGLNNPDAEAVRGIGPIPAGDYSIGMPKAPIDHLGPLAMPLTPINGNTAHGRSGFFMHGDNGAMNHTASDGCIIVGRGTRAWVGVIRAGAVLTVVSGRPPAPPAPSPSKDITADV